MEKITPQGIEDSKKVGKRLLSRYPTLVPTTKKIYADKKSRTQDTAAAFVAVFPQAVEIEEIDTNRTSFHSQNPHKACKAFSKKPGDEELIAFMSKYTVPII
jgi:broad specificity phosphatase PhoE